jgi:hypothetical protein
MTFFPNSSRLWLCTHQLAPCRSTWLIVRHIMTWKCQAYVDFKHLTLLESKIRTIESIKVSCGAYS